MKRSLNYTGRRRIAASSVTIVIGIGPKPSFDVLLDLKPYRLPADGRVFIEAYRRMEWMRFDFGTVETMAAPTDTRLSNFESAEALLFRIRIVSADGSASGTILAEADGLPVQLPDVREGKRRTLLPVQPAHLQGELFRVDFGEGAPVLLVDRELGGDWQAAASSPLVEALVYPSVLRTVLSELLKEGWPDSEGESRGWQGDWAALVERLPAFSAPPESENDYDDWKNIIVEAFCREHRMLNRFNTAWAGGAAL